MVRKLSLQHPTWAPVLIPAATLLILLLSAWDPAPTTETWRKPLTSPALVTAAIWGVTLLAVSQPFQSADRTDRV